MIEHSPLSHYLKKICRKATANTPVLPLSPIPLPNSFIPAGVLMLVTTKEEPTMIFTKRTEHLKVHAGQICFPGGTQERHDDSLLATALREMNEEIGLDKHVVHIVGNVTPHITATGYQITPFIGVCQPPRRYAINADEVTEIFEIPLSYLLDLHNYRIESKRFGDTEYSFYVLDYQEQNIWGATAAILHYFATLHHHD